MYSVTLWPGSWPPSPGLAPWAILIWIWSALARYWAVTPKRAEATCLTFERRLSPASSFTSATILSLPSTSASVWPALTGERPVIISAS